MPVGYKSEVHDKLLTVAEAIECAQHLLVGYGCNDTTFLCNDAMKNLNEASARCDEGNLQLVKDYT